MTPNSRFSADSTRSPHDDGAKANGFGQCKTHDDATLIGRIEPGKAQVILETELGGRRLLDELEDDPLPRIC